MKIKVFRGAFFLYVQVDNRKTVQEEYLLGDFNKKFDLEYLLSLLENKDTSIAFKALKELEQLSDTSNVLYPYTNKFISMIGSKKYVIRVRGFRLFCKQAKWDTDNIIDTNLDFALSILNDEKPNAVRQALTALQDVAMHKKNLHEQIRERALKINYFRYKDTMRSLIAKDIEALLKMIDEF